MSATSLPPVMAGHTILITAHRRSDDLADAFARRGATIRHAAAMSIVEHADDEQLLATTRELLADPPDTLVVTTGQGLRGWFAAADAAGLADDLTRVLADVHIIARGPKAKGALAARGLAPAFVATSETAAEMIDHLLEIGVAGTRIAVQHHGTGSDGIDGALTEAGASVTAFVVYRAGPAPDPRAVTDSVHEVADGQVGTVVFTSAPGVTAWFDVADAEGVTTAIIDRATSGEVLFAAVGPVTAAPLEAKGVTPLVPERSRMGALVRAVIARHEVGADTR